MKEITLKADEFTIAGASEVATSEGKTLEGACYDWLISYASRTVRPAELEDLFESLRYVKAGRKFTRDEMNER